MSRRLDKRSYEPVDVTLTALGAARRQYKGTTSDLSPTHFRIRLTLLLPPKGKFRFELHIPGLAGTLSGVAVIERTICLIATKTYEYVFSLDKMAIPDQDRLTDYISNQEASAYERRSGARKIVGVTRRRIDSVRTPPHYTRVVITGIGTVAPGSVGRENFWEAIRKHKSGISEIHTFNTQGYPVKIAGQVESEDIRDRIPPRLYSRMGRATSLGWLAASLAVKDASANLSQMNKDRIGVAMGTTLGALDWALAEHESYAKGGFHTQHPYTIAAGSCNAISGEISVEHKLCGPSATFSQGCSSSSMAISYGLDLIQLGRADAMLVGGADAPLIPSIFGAFVRSGILSEKRPSTTTQVIKAEDCTGCVLSEGACVLLIESLEHALRRGAHIYGELAAAATSSDGYHMLFPHPSGRGLITSMRNALKDATIDKSKVDLVMAHVAGMREGYDIEMRLLRREFSKSFSNLTVTNVKSLIGYTQGACGAFESAAACLAFAEPVQWIPFGNVVKKKKAQIALINCIGFGGKNTCHVLKEYADN